MSEKTGFTPNRFFRREDGPKDAVWDSWGGYFISAGLWASYMVNGRMDWADHDFRLGERIFEDGVPGQWHERHAECARCGEQRRVYHAVDMAGLNHGWCIP